MADVTMMPVASAIIGLISAIVAILTVVLGLIVRATSAFTRLRMEVENVVKNLADHEIESKADRIELRSTTYQRLDAMANTMSRVDRDVARLSGRRRDAGTT